MPIEIKELQIRVEVPPTSAETAIGSPSGVFVDSHGELWDSPGPFGDGSIRSIAPATDAAGPLSESMETMKKAWKDASATPEGKPAASAGDGQAEHGDATCAPVNRQATLQMFTANDGGHGTSAAAATHGVTERTSGLVYSGESGGMNEAQFGHFTQVVWANTSYDPALPDGPVWGLDRIDHCAEATGPFFDVAFRGGVSVPTSDAGFGGGVFVAAGDIDGAGDPVGLQADASAEAQGQTVRVTFRIGSDLPAGNDPLPHVFGDFDLV